MDDTMRYWLGLVCREAREEHGRLQVHIAASLDRNQSTVARFERGEGWPRDPDVTVAAYADDLDVEPMELWRQAIELWAKSGQQATLEQLKGRRDDEVSERRARRGSGHPRRQAPDRLPRPEDPPQAEEA